MEKEKNSTKPEILQAALNLFSVKGFEATSISQITEAVGIRKATFYSHFDSKQALLDELVDVILGEYNRHSIFANADWNDHEFTSGKENMSPDYVINAIKGQVTYIIHDEKLSKARKMLVIEQYQNETMSKLLTKQNYSDIMKYFTGMMEFLIRKNILMNSDAEIMAAQLCLPVTVWISLCDREPEKENEIMTLIERHVKQFFKLYSVN